MNKTVLLRYKQIASEWDYEANGSARPEDFSPGSNKIVRWKCNKGHSYEARISRRTGAGNRKPSGCPYCSGRKALKGFNDLASTYPDLIKEWDYKKNSVSPDAVTKGSNGKYWWICKECGSSFKSTIGHRLRLRSDGTYGGCNNCKNVRTAKRMAERNLVVGITDLKTLYPNIAAQWDYSLNKDKPEDYSPFSMVRKWWRCDKEPHSYDMLIASRTSQGQGCPYCSGNRVLKGFNDFAYLRPDLLKEWDYENNEKNPDDITVSSSYKASWLCPKGHQYKMIVASRTREEKPSGCPYCANKKVLAGYNDLETLYPEIAKEWDYSKNKKKPSEYVAHSNKKVAWICPKGHSYEAEIDRRTKVNPTGCPICANKQLLVGYNDLKTLFPELSKEWDYNKNKTRPEDHISGTHAKAHWICPKCGHKYEASIKNRAYNGTGCPKCTYYYKTSTPEQAVFYYVQKHFTDAKNSYKPSFLKGMETDIYIPSLNLGIEYDGVLWHTNSERDRRKSELCRENGMSLVRIKEGDATNAYNDDFVIKSEYVDKLKGMDSCIIKLFEYLNSKYNLSIVPDIDVMRDSADIYALSDNIKKKKSLADTNSPSLAEWDYEKNGIITPDKVSPRSKKIVWWKCSKCGHCWQQSVTTKYIGGLYCKTCSNALAHEKGNLNRIKSGKVKSVADYPELLKEWIDDRDPAAVSYGSMYRAKWRCSACGNEFEMIVKNRTKQNQGCRICGRKRIIESKKKPVINIDTGKEYSSLTEASIDTGARATGIRKCCDGEQRQAGGYRWRWKD